jgi:hypothetical protein
VFNPLSTGTALDIRRERRWVELKNQEALADVQTYDSASESRRSFESGRRRPPPVFVGA